MKFKSFFRWVQDILLQFKHHIPSFVILLLFYVLFWNFPQTSDLQLILNQNGTSLIQVPLFFSSLAVIAYLLSNAQDLIRGATIKDLKSFWKSLKFLDSKEEQLLESYSANKKGQIQKEDSKQYVARMFPKVLGTLLILIVAFSVENAYYKILNDSIFIGAKLGIGISLILLVISLNQVVAHWLQGIMQRLKIRDFLSPILAIFALLFIAYMGSRNKGGSEEDIKRLFYSLLMLAIIFFNITTSYSEYVVKFKGRFGSMIINVVTASLLILYVFLIFDPSFLTNSTNPLTIINICITGLFTIVTVVNLAGKLLDLPLLSMSLIVLTIWGFITASNENYSHYDISRVSSKQISVKERPSLESHFKSWIDDRKPIIENNYSESNPFKAIFVSAEGGGSRAGLWSFLVHSYLYERNPDYFEKHLVSMTGASGGSVGNTMFYNIANQRFFDPTNKMSFKNENPRPFIYKASHVYEKDFLSTSVASLLGRDLIQSIVGIMKFDDRGALLENEWEDSYAKVFDSAPSLNNEFLSFPISTDKKTAPLLFINTVNVQKGEFSVISPVTFKENEKTMGVFDDFLLDFDCVDSTSAIKKSSAMSINARFPFISPVGRVKKVGHFMDSGYYDNIGGTVTRRLEEVFQEVLKKYDTSFQKKIKSTFLIIANFEGQKFATNCAERDTTKVNYVPQLIAPAVGILNATFGQKNEMKKTFGDGFLIESKRMEVAIDTVYSNNTAFLHYDSESLKPILPLGRSLSKTVIRSLEKNLTSNPEVRYRLDSLITKK